MTERRTWARERRKEAGFTLAQAAKRLNRSRGHVSYLERSGQWPYDLCLRAARLYHCNPLDLLPLRRRGASPTATGPGDTPGPSGEVDSSGDRAAATAGPVAIETT